MYQWYSHKASRIGLFIVAALVFMVPVEKKVLPPLIILLVLSWVLLLPKMLSHKPGREKLPLVFCLVFFAVYLLGLTWSANVGEGWKSIEVKLSFALLALVFLFHPGYDRKSFRTIMLAFIFGCVFSAFFHLALGVYNYYHEIYLVKTRQVYDVYINTNYFFASLLANRHHPGYLSMYFVFAECAALYLVTNRGQYAIGKKMVIALVLSIALLAGMIFLLASKTGIVLLFAVACIWFAGQVMQKKYSRKTILIALLALVVTIVLLLQSQIVRSRFSYVVQAFTEKSIDKTSTESNEVRLLIWDASFTLIAQKPILGYGTGDAKDSLVAEYARKGYTGAYAHKLNAHSQFLQTQLATGLPGTLSLALIMFTGIIGGIRRRQFLAVMLFFIVLFNILVESMFETQGGVVFFVLFAGIVLNLKDNHTS